MRDYIAIQRRIDECERAEMSARLALMRGARAGVATAIAVLWERYSLRLPILAATPLRQAGRGPRKTCWPKRRNTTCA